IIEYLQEISLYTSSDDELKYTNNAVNLMTVHLSKGLEFKNVFIIEFNEGVFPSKKSIEQNWIDEERRIAYVAMTRAKENLFILSSDGVSFFSNDKVAKVPSRFFEEIKSSKLVIEKEKYQLVSDKDIEWFDSKSKIDFEKNYHENEQEYNIGDTVVHTEFGSGVVLKVTNLTIDVAFKYPYGNKTIMKNHKSIVRKLS
ncbi:MAG: ATP-binding domain-containing protein, partial [Malacoplasma sp.]|nr:ATP-binding domain-containing protein [Malacoplasma sp.]